MNTEFNYLYRDAANHKVFKYVVVEGEITFGDIKEYLDGKEFFIPSQVGLDDLQPWPIDQGNDHPWHTVKDYYLTPTEGPATSDITAAHLLKAFESVEWDEEGATANLLIRDKGPTITVETLELFETKATYTVRLPPGFAGDPGEEAVRRIQAGEVEYSSHEHPGNADQFLEVLSAEVE